MLSKLKARLFRKELARLQEAETKADRRLADIDIIVGASISRAAKEVWQSVVAEVNMEMRRHNQHSPERVALYKVWTTASNRFTERYGHRP